MVDGYYDQLPEMFDPAAHEGTQDLVPVPAGWYPAHIVEAEVRDAANGNGNYLWTELPKANTKAARFSRTSPSTTQSNRRSKSANGL